LVFIGDSFRLAPNFAGFAANETLHETDIEMLAFVFTKDNWPFSHYVNPFMLFMFFGTRIFYDKTHRARMLRKPWPIYSFKLYEFAFGWTVMIFALWELFESIMTVLGFGSFNETPGDSLLGDLGIGVIGTVFAAFLFALVYPASPGILYHVRETWEKIEYIFLFFVFFVGAQFFPTIDAIITTEGEPDLRIHFGYFLWMPLMFIIVRIMELSDLRVARRTEERGFISRDEIYRFYLYTYLLLFSMFLASFGLVFFSYPSVLVGQAIHMILIFALAIILPRVRRYNVRGKML